MKNLSGKSKWIEQIDYINSIFKNNPKDALELIENLYLSLTIEIDEVSYFRALYIKGACLLTLGNLEEAMEVASLMLELAEEYSNNLSIVKAHNLLGNIYLLIDVLDKGLEHYLLGLKINSKVNDNQSEASLLNNIGEIYNRSQVFEEALSYYQRSVVLCGAIDNPQGVALSYLNMGEVYYKMGQFDNAKKYLDSGYSLSKSCDDNNGILYYHSIYGALYHAEKRIDKSLESYKNSLKVATKIGNRVLIVENLLEITDLYMEIDNLQRANDFAKQAIEAAEEVQIHQYIYEASEKLSIINEKKGNINDALYYSKKCLENNKLIEKENHDKLLQGITIQFKIEQIQNEKEIFKLNNLELETKNEELNNMYRNVKIISKIGQDITGTLKLTDILRRIYDNIAILMDTSFFGIALYDKKTGMIDYKLLLENGEPAYLHKVHSSDKKSLASWCVRNDKIIFTNKFSEEYTSFVEAIGRNTGLITESIIYCPLKIGNEIIGVITVQSQKANVYKENHMDTLVALGSYIAIAIKNSQKSDMLELEIIEHQKARIDLEELNKKLEKMSYKDALTEIANRRSAIEFLTFELDRAKRTCSVLTTMLVDIDYYKSFNDFYGHNAGDVCLKKVASILHNTLKRKVDFVARYGGDEFLVVLSSVSKEQAIETAELLCKNIFDANIKHEKSKYGKLTITIGGISLIPNGDITVEKMINLADQALYTAKAKGRNCISFNI